MTGTAQKPHKEEPYGSSQPDVTTVPNYTGCVFTPQGHGCEHQQQHKTRE